MARPLLPINKSEFEKLCHIQCTKAEISGWFDCSDSTLERWCKKTYKASFDVVFDQKRQNGCISLRRKQYQEAMKGNITMLIWLGKQYLGQSDVEKAERKALNDKINAIHDHINVIQLVRDAK